MDEWMDGWMDGWIIGFYYYLGDTKLQLSKYLLRTLCTDMTKLVLTYIASDYNIKVPEDAETFSKVLKRTHYCSTI